MITLAHYMYIKRVVHALVHYFPRTLVFIPDLSQELNRMGVEGGGGEGKSPPCLSLPKKLVGCEFKGRLL